MKMPSHCVVRDGSQSSKIKRLAISYLITVGVNDEHTLVMSILTTLCSILILNKNEEQLQTFFIPFPKHYPFSIVVTFPVVDFHRCFRPSGN